MATLKQMAAGRGNRVDRPELCDNSTSCGARCYNADMEPPITLAISGQRRALAQMYLDLTLAFNATLYAPGSQPSEIDANLALVAIAVMLGHAEGHAMNASQLASRLQMPRAKVLGRLQILLQIGLIERINGRYYLEPRRAASVPSRARFVEILTKAFAIIGPGLSKISSRD